MSDIFLLSTSGLREEGILRVDMFFRSIGFNSNLHVFSSEFKEVYWQLRTFLRFQEFGRDPCLPRQNESMKRLCRERSRAWKPCYRNSGNYLHWYISVGARRELWRYNPKKTSRRTRVCKLELRKIFGESTSTLVETENLKRPSNSKYRFYLIRNPNPNPSFDYLLWSLKISKESERY